MVDLVNILGGVFWALIMLACVILYYLVIYGLPTLIVVILILLLRSWMISIRKQRICGAPLPKEEDFLSIKEYNKVYGRYHTHYKKRLYALKVKRFRKQVHRHVKFRRALAQFKSFSCKAFKVQEKDLISLYVSLLSMSVCIFIAMILIIKNT